ncbi:molybdenum cofactor guanylyltransferase MobA [Shinella sp.]|uniref:molybdenum cofactor guanylyltransferase MobA n=1 Tax=Shinella sp. TaxID=1870904 RepID=UPI003F703BF2
MAPAQAILGVILAGGLSSRMGQDKARIRLGGAALIDRAARRLRPQVSAVAVNANGPVLFERGEELPVFADLDAARAGPLGGVLAALDYAKRHHPEASHVATVPTDSPFFPTDLVARLARVVDTPERMAVARSVSGLHPVFALWPVTLATDLSEWLAGGGALRVRSYLERHQARDITFPLIDTPRGEFDPFFNINTPDDLDEAENWLWVLER